MIIGISFDPTVEQQINDAFDAFEARPKNWVPAKDMKAGMGIGEVRPTADTQAVAVVDLGNGYVEIEWTNGNTVLYASDFLFPVVS